jgi:hypothetical protein
MIGTAAPPPLPLDSPMLVSLFEDAMVLVMVVVLVCTLEGTMVLVCTLEGTMVELAPPGKGLTAAPVASPVALRFASVVTGAIPVALPMVLIRTVGAAVLMVPATRVVVTMAGGVHVNSKHPFVWHQEMSDRQWTEQEPVLMNPPVHVDVSDAGPQHGVSCRVAAMVFATAHLLASCPVGGWVAVMVAAVVLMVVVLAAVARMAVAVGAGGGGAGVGGAGVVAATAAVLVVAIWIP